MQITDDTPPATPAAAGQAPAEWQGRPSLVVWCSDRTDAEPLLRALESTYVLDHRNDLPDPASVDAGAEAIVTLLLCRSPVETLAAAMSDGASPNAALTGWMEQAQALLALNRRNRRRVHILGTGHARRHPEAFRRHFSLAEVSGDLAPPSPDAVFQLMARQLLFDNGQARALAGELEAVTLDLGVEVSAEISDSAFAAYTALRQETELLQAQARDAQIQAETLASDKTSLQARLDSTDEEAQLLRDQVSLMQGELVRVVQDRSRLEARVEQLRQGIESQEAQIAELSGIKQRVRGKERALIAAAETQRNLEMQVADLTTQLTRLRKSRAAAQQRVMQLETSRSYRLMAPLRRVRAILGGRSKA